MNEDFITETEELYAELKEIPQEAWKVCQLPYAWLSILILLSFVILIVIALYWD